MKHLDTQWECTELAEKDDYETYGYPMRVLCTELADKEDYETFGYPMIVLRSELAEKEECETLGYPTTLLELVEKEEYETLPSASAQNLLRKTTKHLDTECEC